MHQRNTLGFRRNISQNVIRYDASQEGGDYGGSKPIRVAQPSGGMSDGKPYGIHFPSKRGAEMVMAYIEGDPSRPLGLGFVPNSVSPSPVKSSNSVENVMRSWGGNELVMTDTAGDKKVKLSTPEARYLELYDGKKLVRLKIAIEAGGLSTEGRPVLAKDYVTFLPKLGFTIVTVSFGVVV